MIELSIGTTSSLWNCKLTRSLTTSVKKAIKKQKENDFKDLDADKLVLYQVSIPNTDDFEERVKSIRGSIGIVNNCFQANDSPVRWVTGSWCLLVNAKFFAWPAVAFQTNENVVS
jgi:Crinkler effector protein N-terminal domain